MAAANPPDPAILEQFGEVSRQLGEMNKVLNSLRLRNDQAKDPKDFKSTMAKLWRDLEESKKKLKALQRFQHLKAALGVLKRGIQMMETSLNAAAELDQKLLSAEQSMSFMRRWFIDKVRSEKAAAAADSSDNQEDNPGTGSGSKKTPDMSFMRQWLIEKLKTESSADSSSDQDVERNQEMVVVGGGNLQEDSGRSSLSSIAESSGSDSKEND